MADIRKIRITKELPADLEIRPEVGGIYEAEYKMTPPPAPRMAYYASVGTDGRHAWVFVDECEEVAE